MNQMKQHPDLVLQTHKEKEQTARTRNVVLLLLGIILIAAVLRTPITSLSPLIDLIRRDIPISSTLSGFLTTLPLLAFAGLSPFVPKLSRTYGVEFTLFGALFLLLAGTLVRLGNSEWTLAFGTILAGLGIAAGNVLIPALIKQEFPVRIGLMTGVYSISMNAFASAASGLSVPIAKSTSLGWKGTMLTISLLCLLAILLWTPQLRFNQRPKAGSVQVSASKLNVWRSGLAWKITIYMGLQSLLFYTFVAWLPDLLMDQGMSSGQGGFMLSMLLLSQIPFTFLIPIVAARLKSQLSLLLGTCFFYLASYALLLVAHGNLGVISIAIICNGIAGGTSFSLAMMFFSLRTRNAREASEVSGMAQSIGYLLAAAGPFVFGALHDTVHNWTLPLVVLICVTLGLLTVGISPARGKKYVFDSDSDQVVR